MTVREKTPFPFRAFQVDRSWYTVYWESDPPPPRREAFVGALFLILWAVLLIVAPLSAKKADFRVQEQMVERHLDAQSVRRLSAIEAQSGFCTGWRDR